ncbi:MAG: DUF7144 family membrane protein [Gaiellales bacterium]
MATATDARRGGGHGRSRSGWIVFASAMLMIAGVVNIINGFTAVHNKHYFSSQLIYHNLTVWGWIFIIWGALQLVSAFGALSRHSFAIYMGVALASISACMWFFFVFAAPFAAIVGTSINVLVVYGLTIGSDAEGMFG